MNAKDLKKKNAGELEAELMNKRKTLADLKFGNTKSKSKNVKQTLALRKDIARILTLLSAAK